MPVKKAAFKALRQNKKRCAKNLKVKKSLKNAVKTGHKLISGQKNDEAKEVIKKAIKMLDKAVSRGIVKKNTAARRKSRLTKKLNALSKK